MVFRVLVPHHVVSGQEPLEELGLFVLDGFDDELVIAGQVEERPAGPRVGQLDQGLIHQRVLRSGRKQTFTQTTTQKHHIAQTGSVVVGAKLHWFDGTSMKLLEAVAASTRHDNGCSVSWVPGPAPSGTQAFQ